MKAAVKMFRVRFGILFVCFHVLILALKDCGCRNKQTKMTTTNNIVLHERACYCSLREEKPDSSILLGMYKPSFVEPCFMFSAKFLLYAPGIM